MFRVGIIGCGLIGKKRVQAIQKISNNDNHFGKIVLCCDIDYSKACQLADLCKGEPTSSWQEITRNKNVDVIVVSTVNKFLAPIVIEAIQNRKHVLCEKPLGRNVEESRAILNALSQASSHKPQAPLVLKTGFNHRHHPGIMKARELVDQGEIGPLYYMRCRYGHGGRPGYDKEWRADKDLCGGGELLDQGVHVVDLFQWFMGAFEDAFGYIPTYFWDMPVEDNAFALFKTIRNQVAFMHTSWTQWKNIFSFEVFGEAGYIIVDGLGGSYGPETLKIGKRPRTQSLDLRVSYEGGAPEEETIIFDGPDVSWELEWKEFIFAIKEKRQPIGDGFDGFDANRMIEAVYRSAKENRPVKITEIE